ncbi:exported hypothetical protein [Xanthomonas citri pv. fuscans]|nr:hypothetical protein XcfCFBP6994P_01615 [Xanthomonas citri pv. phaseoli var. fuscans]SOO32728.1 exported hypothetical protein [Xanthomonas citri pv. fuscans]
MKRRALQRHGQLPLVQNWLKSLVMVLAISASPAMSVERMTHLATETSDPGETMDAFVLRLAPKLNKMTRQLRAEVCGTIRTEDGRYVVDVRTYHDFYSCYVERDGLPYIHTHPSLLRDCWTFSLGDWKRPGYLVTEIGVRYQDTKRSRKVKADK